MDTQSLLCVSMDAPQGLAGWRKAEGFSQEAAAELVHVHQNTWSDWENGKKAPRVAMAMRLHVLTRGACPIWAWADDPSVQDEFKRALENTPAQAAA